MGLTSATETAEVAQWAKQYPGVAAEIAAIQSGLESYAQTHAVEPSAAVKEKIFATFNTNTDTASPVVDMRTNNEPLANVYAISPVWKYAAAASIILLIGSLILNYTFYNKYQSANAELATTESELQQQKDIAAAMEGDMDVIQDRNTKPFVLAGMPDVADAQARIYWMKNTGDVYIDPSNLPEAPKGKQYQFWAIVDGKPVSGGMINTSKGNKTIQIQKMKSFGSAQAFAVSLEDAGPEAPAPTKVMVMGKI